MKNNFLFILIICAISLFQSCGKTGSHNISDSTLSYLNEALDIMEANSINKYKIDWDEFRNDVLTSAENINEIDSTYPVIKYALNKLGDNHSQLIENFSEQLSRAKNRTPYSRLLENNIAYIHIPSFLGKLPLAKSYATRLHGFVKSYALKNVSGWIIDLRENWGGDMWPMIAGIGPLLGQDTSGFFVDADNNYAEWYYENGSSCSGGKKICSIIGDAATASIESKRIAVLIGKATASAGEAVAVSLKGMADTKFFGESTMGLSTANKSFKLSNGAALILTIAYFADRDKNVYGKKINPDYEIQNPAEINKKENDKVIISAMDWITYNYY